MKTRTRIKAVLPSGKHVRVVERGRASLMLVEGEGKSSRQITYWLSDPKHIPEIMDAYPEAVITYLEENYFDL